MVYFISDTHFGHDNIIKLRDRFTSIEEHDRYILDNIKAVTNKKTKLFILGDVILGNSIEPIKEILSTGTSIEIVLGNHDGERSGSPQISDYIELGIKVHGLKKYKEFWLSHSPIHHLNLRGKINIHGHTHSYNINDNNYVNVSCENIDYKPVSLQEIRRRNMNLYCSGDLNTWY